MKFISTFARAFYSAELYRRLRREGDFAFSYSFKLVGFCSFLLVLGLLLTAHARLFSERNGQRPLFDAAILQLVPQLPAMRWQAGQLETLQPGRYEVALTFNGMHGPERATVATIDTSGALHAENAPQGVTVTRNEVMHRDTKKITVRSLGHMSLPETWVLERADYQRLAEQLIGTIHHFLWGMYAALGVVGWLLLTLVLYIGRIALLVPIAGVLMLVQSSLGEPLAFRRIMALVTVAYTPVAVADTLAMLFFYNGTPLFILLPAGLALAWVALRVSESDTTLAA